jgi:endonuclease/exonuclease/phosphatase family metal-dependent hydrolase
MPGDAGARVTVVTLNTRGIPIVGSDLAARYAAIGAVLAAGDADVVCFQEVLTWWHLGLLRSRLRSFPHMSYRSSRAGPAGGVVTFSRLPVAGRAYHRFGLPPEAPGISRGIRLRAGLKGALVTTLRASGLAVVNTHPVANWDGDWTPGNRFYPLHQAQLAVLARVMREIPGPAVLCGDFNLARDSSLFDGFMAETGLGDAFEGRCPPTFRAEYLPEGKPPHCIDFILTGGGVKAEDAALAFTGPEPLSAGPGYVSDHIGLRATLVLMPPS